MRLLWDDGRGEETDRCSTSSAARYQPGKSVTTEYVWRWRARLPERWGHRCRVVARGRLNSILVEFEDGFRVVTSRYAVRRAVMAERPTWERLLTTDKAVNCYARSPVFRAVVETVRHAEGKTDSVALVGRLMAEVVDQHEAADDLRTRALMLTPVRVPVAHGLPGGGGA